MKGRVRVLVLIVVLFGGGLVADATVDRPRPRRVEASSGQPSAADRGSLSATWFCTGATSSSGGQADGTIVIVNPSEAPVTGTVTVMPPRGQALSRDVRVDAASRLGIRAREIGLDAPFASAQVDLDSGGAAVELLVKGPLGEDATPCASSVAERWYFADGSTAKDATLLISLFNPFPEDAIADLSFSTEQGRAVPADYQGVVVPARGSAVVNVGERVRRRESVATTVVSRTGRIVATKLQLRTAPGITGVGLTIGAPRPLGEWYFPEGVTNPGVGERYSVYNPGNREAIVDLEFTLDEGAAEPVQLTVAPRDRAVVMIGPDVGVAPGVAHAVTARTVNDVPVVVERTINAAAPSPRVGYSTALGAREAATRWVFGIGAANEKADEWLVVQNPSTRDVTVDVIGLASGQRLRIDGLQDVAVVAGGRRALRLGDHVSRGDLALLLEASGPVIAERDLYLIGKPGISMTPGIPLREE